jgi:hypothetical protein
MPSKLRLCYYAALILFSGLAFFGLWTWPKTWDAVVSFLVPLEAWWTAHAAHPVLSAFMLGLVFSTGILVEVWRLVRPLLFPPEYEADVPAFLAFDSILTKSKWAKASAKNWKMLAPLVYEKSYPQEQVIENRVEHALKDAFHNLLTQGKITAWGKPDHHFPERKITETEWHSMKIDFHNREPRWHACAWTATQPSRISFIGIRLSQAQIDKVFPRSMIPRKRLKIASQNEQGSSAV